MKKISSALLLMIGAFALVSFAQTSNIRKSDMAPPEVDRIIKQVAANEDDFRYALSNYVFNRSATIQTVGMGGQITGVYRRDSFMTFSSEGQRFERVTFAPVSTLTEISVTPEDLEDLGGVNPFAIEPRYIPQYNFGFVGKEKIDDLELYVFDVTPKKIPSVSSGQRLFTGRIWVDERDLMIVKSKGKAVPETKRNKFPIVETWRENVDGKYWFPAYSFADDELVFDSGQVVRMRMKVTYDDYRVGRSDVRVLDTDEDIQDEPLPTPSPSPRRPQ
ncbi:MAG: hypothetical protein H0V76_10570 [Blastocatellia bacterium]|nr:hypothetical protein [Blastocatellia bacterium]